MQAGQGSGGAEQQISRWGAYCPLVATQMTAATRGGPGPVLLWERGALSWESHHTSGLAGGLFCFATKIEKAPFSKP